nr:MAG: capsid protein [ticpantry virus 13]
MRAINSGSSSTLVQVTRSGMTSFTFAANSNTSNVLTICPWGVPNASASQVPWTSAVASALYQTYASIYDEVRLERMEVSMSPAKSMVSGQSTLMIYSAVDRKFTSRDTVQSVGELTQAAGVVVRNVQPASTVPFKRVIYPRDLQEKITYVDCSWGTSGTPAAYYLSAWNIGQNNITLFSPAISYGLLSTTASTEASNLPYVFTIKYYLRFRNPKTEVVNSGEPPVVNQSLANGMSVILNSNPPQNDVVVEESNDADSTVK